MNSTDFGLETPVANRRVITCFAVLESEGRSEFMIGDIFNNDV